MKLVSRPFKRVTFLVWSHTNIFHRITDIRNIAFSKSAMPNLKHRIEHVSKIYHHLICFPNMGNGYVQGWAAAFV